jgi:hypothetical protein
MGMTFRYSLAFTAALLTATVALADQDVTHAFHSSVPRGRVQRVVIDIPTGEFTLRTGAATTLALSGIASRDYDTAKERDWAQGVVNDTSVEFYVNGTEAVVRRRFGPKASSWRSQKFTGMDLRIDLPPGMDVTFETTAGEVDLDGQFGNVSLDMRAGEIKLRMPKTMVRELNASARIGEVRTHIGNDVTSREGILPGKTKYFNAGGKSVVNVHVTAGEVDVTLTP